MKNFELHNTEIKGDTVVIDFADNTGTVRLQLSKKTLLTHMAEYAMNDCDGTELHPATYLNENLTEVVQSYLDEL